MTAQAARTVAAQNGEAKDHNLVAEAVRESVSKHVHYEKRPVKGADGKPVAGLFNAWITLDNQGQFNSYTTDMVKATILAFRAASAARDVVAVVFTGAGDKAFCTGGNTQEYAEYYAGNPQEYRGYMRRFNDMVSAIIAKPVVCRATACGSAAAETAWPVFHRAGSGAVWRAGPGGSAPSEGTTPT
jgi:6-oxo-cyclohex-1-ene-carbonyl-CoA hydrolase